jgi:hypothetical protein
MHDLGHYPKFLDRAGAKDTSTFSAYMGALAAFATRSVPFVVVTGVSLLRYFPVPTMRLDIRFPRELHKGAECVVIAYNVVIPLSLQTTLDVIEWLASTYSCVGDPSCGYGNTGRVFVEHGKQCVMSDINAKCIGWIADHCAQWSRT